MSSFWSGIDAFLTTHESFSITSHLRPDADALGSELAIAALLRQMGKQARILNPGAAPEHLRFLDLAGEIQTHADVPGVFAMQQAHIIVDTSSWMQLGDMGGPLRNSPHPVVVIDHHLPSDEMPFTIYRDTQAPAAGCLVLSLYRHLGLTPTAEAARAMFAAIATDTGWYRFPSTISDTYRQAADLIDFGVRPSELYEALYERSSLARLRLIGRCLGKIEVTPKGRVAYTTVSLQDLRQAQAHPADTENLVNECLKIDGVVAAFVVVEQYNRRAKVSLRAREPFDVAAVAKGFGGGGHRLASGAMIDGPLMDACASVLQAMQAAMEADVS